MKLERAFQMTLALHLRQGDRRKLCPTEMVNKTDLQLPIIGRRSSALNHRLPTSNFTLLYATKPVSRQANKNLLAKAQSTQRKAKSRWLFL